MEFMIWIINIIGGYLYGSVSPSYILGKVLKNIDIRDHGTGNAGTINTYKVLGLGPAVITAMFDVSKGLLVMYIAHLLGAPPLWVHLAGFAVILGHVFPFYLKFRGGQGVATATAILIYYLVLFYIKNWLPIESLIFLTIAVISFFYITKKEEVVGIVILSSLAIFILVFSSFQLYKIFILTIITYILFINILNIRRERFFKLSSKKAQKEMSWRLYLRPLAVLLIINYLKTNKKETLILIGIIALFFLFLDLIRLFSRKINIFFFEKIKDIYKSKEYKKFSSITLFLIASFLAIFLFDKNIAILAVSYLIFGDFFSKFFGLRFGRTEIFDKTFEGSLAHFNACLISGYILLQFFSLPIYIYLTGALVASVAELLPLGVDDNFSVALLSASTMYVFHFF